LIIYLWAYQFTEAQDTDLERAEETYRYVNDQIERKEYLINEFKINANRLDLHEAGYFQHWERFFYVFNKKLNTPHQPLLQAVVIRTEKQGVNTFQEYIFDTAGNCVFYSEMQRAEGEIDGVKLKIFLHQGKSIKWLKQDEEVIDKSEKPESKILQINNEVKKLKQKFLNQFADIQFH
jgi:hypothetical protein